MLPSRPQKTILHVAGKINFLVTQVLELHVAGTSNEFACVSASVMSYSPKKPINASSNYTHAFHENDRQVFLVDELVEMHACSLPFRRWEEEERGIPSARLWVIQP
jgi:hypothetical protein